MFQSEILTGVIRCDKLDTETAESGDEMSEVRKHFVVHGKVQGVGFRYTAKYLALSLGLTGWARNEWDGTVTMEVQGRETLINKLLVGLNQNQFISMIIINQPRCRVHHQRGAADDQHICLADMGN